MKVRVDQDKLFLKPEDDKDVFDLGQIFRKVKAVGHFDKGTNEPSKMQSLEINIEDIVSTILNG